MKCFRKSEYILPSLPEIITQPDTDIIKIIDLINTTEIKHLSNIIDEIPNDTSNILTKLNTLSIYVKSIINDNKLTILNHIEITTNLIQFIEITYNDISGLEKKQLIIDTLKLLVDENNCDNDKSNDKRNDNNNEDNNEDNDILLRIINEVIPQVIDTLIFAINGEIKFEKYKKHNSCKSCKSCKNSKVVLQITKFFSCCKK